METSLQDIPNLIYPKCTIHKILDQRGVTYKTFTKLVVVCNGTDHRHIKVHTSVPTEVYWVNESPTLDWAKLTGEASDFVPFRESKHIA